jgi:hypothetical protein
VGQCAVIKEVSGRLHYWCVVHSIRLFTLLRVRGCGRMRPDETGDSVPFLQIDSRYVMCNILNRNQRENAE